MRFPKRYFFFAGTFMITLLLYVDRVCISSAKDSIAGDLMLNDTQMGWVMAIFSLGYALFQVPGGILGDRFGPRKVLTSIIGIWSVLTAMSGMAWNYMSMLFFRFTFGVGEAGAFPNIAKAAYFWVPMKERGIFQGINFSGSRLGAAFALPAVAFMIELWGWRSTFYIFGAVGVIFALSYFFLFRDKPEEHPAISQEEKDFIQANRQQSSSTDKPKLSANQLLSSTNVWLAMGQYISSNFIFFFMLTWLFPYVKEKYDLNMVSAGLYAMLPLLAGAVGNWLSGIWVDALYRKGKWQLSRRLPAIIGFLLVVIGIVASLYMETVNGAIFFLSIAVLGADMTLSPSWSFCIDIGKENSGTVSGTMNMAGNLGSFATALAFPYLQAWTGSNDPFFFVCAGLAVIAIFCWAKMDATKPLIPSVA